MYVWGGNGRVYGIDPVSEDTSFAPAEEFHRKEKVGERSSLPPLALPLLVGLLIDATMQSHRRVRRETQRQRVVSGT